MDCLQEWNQSMNQKRSQQLIDAGKAMVLSVTMETRHTLMADFVNGLEEEGIERDHAWALCAEAYANAMVLVEITKLIEKI